MISRIRRWWRGAEKYRRAGVKITEEGILYKRADDIVNSSQGRQILQSFCELAERHKKNGA